jgi:hypothetical protein
MHHPHNRSNVFAARQCMHTANIAGSHCCAGAVCNFQSCLACTSHANICPSFGRQVCCDPTTNAFLIRPMARLSAAYRIALVPTVLIELSHQLRAGTVNCKKSFSNRHFANYIFEQSERSRVDRLSPCSQNGVSTQSGFAFQKG